MGISLRPYIYEEDSESLQIGGRMAWTVSYDRYPPTCGWPPAVYWLCDDGRDVNGWAYLIIDLVYKLEVSSVR